MAAQSVKKLLMEFGLEEAEADLTLRDLADAYIDQRLLISIGRSLNMERDTEKLLHLILHVARKITSADAGSIFLLEDGGKTLRFAYAHTHSLDLDYQEFVMERDRASIAGYVSLTGDVLNIDDAYRLPDGLPYRFNPSFDMLNGYRTKSMLVVPMKNHLDQIIGVIQLINSKEKAGPAVRNAADSIRLETKADFEKMVTPFKARYESLMVAVANQAAIALENSRMIKQIHDQFEAFVSASVMAVESRDPATSGHSFRVSVMAQEIAKAISHTGIGPYAKRQFSENELKELRYSGLLHDFGKVYIDPQVFLKAKKLYPRDFDYLRLRLRYLQRSGQAVLYRRALDSASCGRSDEASGLGRDAESLLCTLGGIEPVVAKLNEPQQGVADPAAEIGKIMGIELPDFVVGLGGEPIPLLTEEEIDNLLIPRGSLNSRERAVIESHVEHTYAFVSKIPWPPEYPNIPEYAFKHHEFLDGSGYPRGLSAPDIPLQARILTVCDIFDALIASDRPYKKALPLSQSIIILNDMAEKGKLDKEVVRIMVENRVWDAIPASRISGT
jgi:HD-GYP domain-containing protein (c-di-GMP phosphodiesterase class II)